MLFDSLESQALGLIFLIRPWFLFFPNWALYTVFSWITVTYKCRFPQVDSRICEFLVLEMRVHSSVSLHGRIYNFLNFFSNLFTQLGLLPGDLCCCMVIYCLENSVFLQAFFFKISFSLKSLVGLGLLLKQDCGLCLWFKTFVWSSWMFYFSRTRNWFRFHLQPKFQIALFCFSLFDWPCCFSNLF